MSIRTSLAWSYGSQALTLVINFAASVAVARLLSPREVGTYALAMAISGILAVFTSLNLQSYVVREGELAPDTVRSIYTLNALTKAALALAMLGIAAVEQVVFGQAAIAAVLAISSVGPLFDIFEFVPAALYQREMQYGVLSRVGLGRTVITAGVTVTCAAVGFGARAQAFGPVAGAIFAATCYSVLRRRDLVIRPTRRGLKPAAVFGLQIMSISGVAQITQRLSDLVLARFLGIAALGLYSRASNLANIVFGNVYGLATGVVFVKLAKDLRETGSLRATFVLSLRMITACVWPLMAGIGVLSGPLISILYGPKWLAAAPALSLLMLSQFIVLGFGMNWELFVLRRETARQVRFEAARATVGLAAFAIGSLFSITAAALGRVVEAIVGYVLYRPHVDRLAGTEKGDLERVFGESLLLTAIAVAPSLLLMTVERWAHDTSPPLIAGAVGLGVAGWFAALVARRHPLIAELRLALGKLRAMQTPA